MLNSRSKTSARGFTLIELIVAVGLFSVILLIIVGAYTRFVTAQRRTIAEQQLQEDVRISLDQFSRDARTAYGNTFPTGQTTAVTFRNQNNICVLYERSAIGQFTRTEAASPDVVACDDPALYEPAAALSLTDEGTVIETLAFISVPADHDSQFIHSQGYITITLGARARGKDDVTYTAQSTFTSRKVVPYIADEPV